MRKQQSKREYWCHSCEIDFLSSLEAGQENISCPKCGNDFCELMTVNSSAKKFKAFQKQPIKKKSRQLKLQKASNIVNILQIHQILEQQTHQKQGIQVSDEQLKSYQKQLQKDSECSVCRQDLKAGSRQLVFACSHSFHKECLEEWLKIKNSCPSCRKKMIESQVI